MTSSRHVANPFLIKNHLPLATRRFISYQTRHRPRSPINRPFDALRHFSTRSSALTRLSNFLYGTGLILGCGLLYLYITDTRAGLHRWLVVPALRLLYRDAEEAHHAGNSALKLLWRFGLYPRERGDPDGAGDLQVDLFGYNLVNPIATSAGIDKKADIPDPLFAIGPAIVELGGVTPLPQDGNLKPRVFRVPSQNALINRYGLNSEGADHMAMRLRHRVREFARARKLGTGAEAVKYVLDGHANVPPGSLMPGRLLAVNIAKNATTPDGDIDRIKEDYVYCVQQLGPYSDILVVNVSSPNTPGLRSLQQSKPLTKILTAVVDAAQKLDRIKKPAVMVKVSPDEDTDDQIAGVCEAVLESGVDGVIVGNTTNHRPDPVSSGYRLSPAEAEVLYEKGGYSGPQLFRKTISLVKKYRILLDNPLQQARVEETKGIAPPDKLNLQKPGPVFPSDKIDGVQASVSSGKIDFKNPSDVPDSDKQPLLQIPTEKRYSLSAQSANGQSTIAGRLLKSDDPKGNEPNIEEPSGEKPRRDEPGRDESRGGGSREDEPERNEARISAPKVIFASGGITNGKQALEALNANANVVMVYSALVYFGAGTISSIKDQMRTEIKKANVTGTNEKTPGPR